MRSYHQAFYSLKQSLSSLYEVREATAIAHEVLYHLTGLDKLQRLVEKDRSFSSQQNELFEQFSLDLLAGRPLQYVLGYTWFRGHRFSVDERVLIPRPETEELVEWIVADYGNVSSPLHLLDVGTGSGCIPISIKLALPQIAVDACDLSLDALAVARKNAIDLGADVHFTMCDILDPAVRNDFPRYEVLVSNPPYIPIGERDALHVNVKNFEPSMALFTPDDDPLRFYKAICEFSLDHLSEGGAIYLELHRDYAVPTADLFASVGYEPTLRNDMHGNARMLKAQRRSS